MTINRKLISLLLTICLLAGLLPTTAFAADLSGIILNKAEHETPGADLREEPFNDVAESDWFYQAVALVQQLDLMKGTDDTTFDPDAPMTRGMVVTILYRLAQEPEVSGPCPFDDVKPDSYYEKAITWAAGNAIVNGYSDKAFGPDDPITREQMLTILYRYSVFLEIEFPGIKPTSYPDSKDISPWALAAVDWAAANNIITGFSDGRLGPKETLTRAQAATMLMRQIKSAEAAQEVAQVAAYKALQEAAADKSAPPATPAKRPSFDSLKPVETGLDKDGRITAKFGTPFIDGMVDDVWAKAPAVTPLLTANTNVKASGTFKVLWDDNALYVLASVKDPNMSVAPQYAYEQDSIEIFLDENNDKTMSYGSDDLHFRVNYDNIVTVDFGNGTRLYTAARKTADGYSIEARIEFSYAVNNDDVLGIELQINDAIGNHKAGLRNVFDETGNAWQDTSLFGEVIFSGKETGDESGTYPYELIYLVEKASVLDAVDYQNFSAVNDALTAAEDALDDPDTTQQEIDDAFAVLKTALNNLKVAGLNDEGRIVAKYASPVIDGQIDEVWDDVPYVTALASGSGFTDSKAKFKALWDDYALYILANVTDSALDTESGTVNNRDSVEIYMDEGNNSTENFFDLDDIHFRINCENGQSSDRGNLDCLYSEVKKTETGYILEARIEFQYAHANDDSIGLELQLNDASNGNRTGTLNVFDKTCSAFADPTLFGELEFAGRGDDATTNFGLYNLLSTKRIAEDIQLDRYTDKTSNEVKTCLALVDTTIASGNSSDMTTLWQQLWNAIGKLEHKDTNALNESLAKEKEFRRIPKDYRSAHSYPDESKGTIERVTYDTYLYGSDDSRGDSVTKNMLVYLPAGYDSADSVKKYNVLYLLHGTSEDQNTVFGDVGKISELKKVLDKMIANDDMDPMIVVTPTWYDSGSQPFHNELVNEIIPTIEGTYNTYAKAYTSDPSNNVTLDVIKATRAHRAIGGFSQGAISMWNIMQKHLDCFKYYVPLSAGPGVINFAALTQGYNTDDYYIFAATGTDDIAYSGMKYAIPDMGDLEGVFNYTADLTKGNLYFLCLEGGTHCWQYCNQYLYNILPDLFFKEKS